MPAVLTDTKRDPPEAPTARLVLSIAWRVGALAVFGLGACTPEPAKPQVQLGPREAAVVVDEPEYEVQVLEPSAFEPLEVLHFPTPTGEGYRRVEAKLGPPIYSGKWLRLANGDSRFLADRHLIVTEYPKRPKNPRLDPIVTNVIVDVETSEVVATFERRLDVHWAHGFALVTQAGDATPMLFTPEQPGLVRALPEGNHHYSLGENYWLRISPIAPRVWISALDDEGQAHLYEWEDLGKPPPLPDSPVAFVPEEWYPLAQREPVLVDHEEVWNSASETCRHAILEPPRGFRCLDGTLSARTKPVGEGWRFDRREGTVFHDPTKRISLAKLCPHGKLDMHVFYDTMLRLQCIGEDSVWGLWSAPDQVRLLDETWASRVIPPQSRPNEPAVDDGQRLLPSYHRKTGALELWGASPPATMTRFDPSSRTRELVARDYPCADLTTWPGDGVHFGISCRTSTPSWFELVDGESRTRGRLRASDMALTAEGKAVVVTGRGGAETLRFVEIAQSP